MEHIDSKSTMPENETPMFSLFIGAGSLISVILMPFIDTFFMIAVNFGILMLMVAILFLMAVGE